MTPMTARDPERQFTPEEEAKVARAQFILYAVMVAFIVLPFLVAWLTGAFGRK